MLDQEDEGTRIGVWVALGVVFFVLMGVIGGLVLRQTHHAADARKATSPKAAMEILLEGPLAGEVVATLYFDSGVAALPADSAGQVDLAAKALARAPTRKLVLAGFHDASGDVAINAGLAKQRAMNARAALVAAGADLKRVLLRKPESTTGEGSLQEARRVEMRLVE